MAHAAGSRRDGHRQEGGAPGRRSVGPGDVPPRHLGAAAIDVGALATAVGVGRYQAASGNQKRTAAECNRIGTTRDRAGTGAVKVVESPKSQTGMTVGAR